MSELHDALKHLGPAEWASFPKEQAAVEQYLKELYTNVELIVDSVPVLAPDNAAQKPEAKANGHARNASEVSLSAERPAPPPEDHEKLQKNWGKPLKIKAAENTLGLSVYKMSGKDSKGSWFARHSVHEGIGFARFKRSMQMEFEKSLAEPGPPGTGNVRGIGGEERVERIETGEGKVEVFRLSAQFPGPTAARDFVTMLITSDKAMSSREQAQGKLAPRHYMIVSRPCDHPSTQPQSGFVRGFYESIEFIREVPRKLKHTQSSLDLETSAHAKPDSRPRSATDLPAGRTAENQGPDPADPEDNPVEWVMITRSDPGGGIPRFLVERGTPSSICGDAVKFLDWACQNDEDLVIDGTQTKPEAKLDRRESYQSWKSRSLAGLEERDESTEQFPNIDDSIAQPSEPSPSNSGIFDSVAGAAAVLKPYTPQVILDRLPGAEQESSPAPNVPSLNGDSLSPTPRADDARSVTTFASAEDHWTSSSSEDEAEEDSLASRKSTESKEQTHHEKELRKIQERRLTLQKKFADQQAKLEASHAKQAQNTAELSQKALDKHEKEVKKHEEKFKKELSKLEKKQEKENKKAADKAKKQADKNEVSRYKRERDEAVQELDLAKKELESLHAMIADLQKQNNALAMKLGRAGPETGLDETRSRGSSMSRRVNDSSRDLPAQPSTASLKSEESAKSRRS